MSQYNENSSSYNDDLYMDVNDVEYTTIDGEETHQRRPARTRSGRSVGKRLLAVALAACLVAGTALASVQAYIKLSGIENEPQVQKTAPAAQAEQQTTAAVPEQKVIKNGSQVVYTIEPRTGALSLQEIFVKVSPSVVSISSQVRSYYGMGEATGTGIVMSEDGYIITNHHVIEGASKVTVTVNGGQEYEAKIVGSEGQSDIAVLKIEAAGLTPAEFGKSEELVTGDDAIVIGNPLGTTFADTMTHGIISSPEREVTIDRYKMTLIQTDAAINPGNSGGPLVNSRGQVVGVVNAKISRSDVEGIGFAIPIDQALTIANDLIDHGHVTGRPMLGITIQSISQELALYYGYEPGITVTEVSQGSPAEQGGMKVGDKIVAFNGVEVSTSDELNFEKNKCKIGDAVTVTVEREGQRLDLTIVLSAGTAA